jgi:hypothetical protein
MNAREELHHLAERDWDAYFASLPRGEETLTAEERDSIRERDRTEEVLVTLEELRAEIESK